MLVLLLPPPAHAQYSNLAGTSNPTTAAQLAASQPATSQPARDWTAINGVETFRREFLLRRDVRVVGTCALTEREFQHGVVLRMGLEFRVFATGQETPAEYFWFEGYTSERSDGAPIASWATGRQNGLGMNYHMRGAKGGFVNFKGNLFDVGHRNPRPLRVPPGYGLLRALAGRLGKALAGKVGESFTWTRYIWREWEPTWHEYRYTYEGPGRVSPVGGESMQAYRFKVEPVGVNAPAEMLWVDQRGYPLRRVVSIEGGQPWEMIVIADPTDRKPALMSWDEAKRGFEAEAEGFLQTIGAWY